MGLDNDKTLMDMYKVLLSIQEDVSEMKGQFQGYDIPDMRARLNAVCALANTNREDIAELKDDTKWKRRAVAGGFLGVVFGWVGGFLSDRLFH
ncbi:MAG: hypothetical protein ACOYIG_09365 [Acetivibrionales bacterium]|jgi:hypothetical protein